MFIAVIIVGVGIIRLPCAAPRVVNCHWIRESLHAAERCALDRQLGDLGWRASGSVTFSLEYIFGNIVLSDHDL